MNKKQQRWMLGIIALLLLIVSGGASLKFTVDDLGYMSGFQGPKPRFAGVNYGGAKYSSTENPGASMLSLESNLMFDSDKSADGKPNIEGEMTTVFVPEESLSGSTTWLPISWLQRNDLIQNPQKTYSWNITTGNTTRVYKMEQWVMKFYVSFSAHWDGLEAGLDWANVGQNIRNAYTNAEIWIEFDIKPTWYIEGGGTAYFAIGKIQLAQDALKEAKDNMGTKQDVDTQESVIPESGGSSLYIYNGLWGLGSAETTEQSYQGKKLNPALFRDKVYAKITLANFGIRSWNEFTTVKTKGDVATFDFNIYVFVIGEWDVKDIQELPEDYGRNVKLEENPSLLDYMSDPRVQALLSVLALGALFIGLLIFAPWVLFALVGLFRSGRRR